MKNYYYFIIVAILMIGTSNILLSQIPCNTLNQTPCPQGTTGPYCFIMNYTIPETDISCDVAVYYCLGISYVFDHYEIITSFHHLTLPCPTLSPEIGYHNLDFQGKMWQKILEDVYSNHAQIFPPCNPPNTTGYLVMETRSVNCLQLENVPYPPVPHTNIIPCESSFLCTDYYFVCFDVLSGKPVKQYDHSVQTSSPDCPVFDIYSWQPPPPLTWNLYFKTECVYWDCPPH